MRRQRKGPGHCGWKNSTCLQRVWLKITTSKWRWHSSAKPKESILRYRGTNISNVLVGSFLVLCTVISINISFVMRQHLHLLDCLMLMQAVQILMWWTMPGVEPRPITSFCLLRGSYMKAMWRTPHTQVLDHAHFSTEIEVGHRVH